jgi:hypothetical protein
MLSQKNGWDWDFYQLVCMCFTYMFYYFKHAYAFPSYCMDTLQLADETSGDQGNYGEINSREDGTSLDGLHLAAAAADDNDDDGGGGGGDNDVVLFVCVVCLKELDLCSVGYLN